MGRWSDHLAADGVEIDAADVEQNNQIMALTVQAAEYVDEITVLKAKLAEYETPDPDPDPEPQKKPTHIGSSLHTAPGETKEQSYWRRAQDWGAEPEIVRYFFDGMPTGWPQFGNAQSVVSFKPPSNDVAGIASGKYDTFLKAWLKVIGAGKKVRRVAFYHEREDNIEDGQFTKATARAADAHLKELIDEANAQNGSNIRFGIILMQWTIDPRSGRDIDDYLPTGWTYDWMGWDAYPGDSADNDLPDLDYTTVLYERCKRATEAHGANNWFICETGTQNHAPKPDPEDEAAVAKYEAAYDDRQARWITGAAGIAREKGCRGWMYFDSTVGGDFRIKGPKAKAAMGTQIKQ